jgi:radical SAM protein with 4Fe4S-binding SPASM domain
MLEYAKYKGFEIRHTTNGSIFNVEALKYIDVLTYSLDGISKNILDNIRKNIKVDEAIDKLIFIKNYIKNNSLDTKLRINTALNKINYIDIDNLYKFCDIESIDLTITPTVNNYNHNSSFFLNMEKSIKEDNIMIDWMTVANTYISNNYNFHLEIFYPKREVKGLCTFNFKDIFINNQGNLISCCRRLARPEEFGDLKVQSIDEVFNTKKMKVFKEAHLNNKPFELCDKCSYGVPL